MKHRIITLGCKVNQCESAAIGRLLEATRWECAKEGDCPDAIIINTCTVTGRAAMQSRQAIRQAIRNHPTARVIVTGCYAQTAADEVLAIAGVDRVLKQQDKMRIADLLSSPCAFEDACEKPLPESPCTFSALPAVDRPDRTRAFLKIQDGCNARCTYCIVPSARGRSRSMPVQDVHTHLARLGTDGLREVVLTGIHLGAYGLDLQPCASLTELLAGIVEKPQVDRVRLSSIEPTEMDDRILDCVLASKGALCRHFHIPLQSGDNQVLRRMGRPYDREKFAAIIEAIAHRLPDACIGVDVMAGFPGETEAAFLNTHHLIASLPISYLHVFPFSPRKGTPAAAFDQKVPQSVAKERCRLLRVLGAEKRSAFYKKMAGHKLKVLIETAWDEKTGFASGLSDNYIPVKVMDKPVQANTLIDVHIEGVAEDGAVIGKKIEDARTRCS
jgi:threonylcarbamoyladenosine tRNA methylthiotransferase MtaB